MTIMNQMAQEKTHAKETPIIKVGSIITYQNSFGEKHTYTIVPPNEMDIRKGKISIVSPLAQSVLGKLPGETTVVKAPSGEYQIEILRRKFIMVLCCNQNN